MSLFYANQKSWEQKAESILIPLRKENRRPLKTVQAVEDPDAWQSWKMKERSSVEASEEQFRGSSFEFTVDFGTHICGYLSFKLDYQGKLDCPFRMKLIFAEVAAETAIPFDPYCGSLGRAWLQDETITIDEIPCEIRLPRRYAFRYVKFEAEHNSNAYQTRIYDINCESVSSGDPDKIEVLPDNQDKLLSRIDEISIRTLKNCMHNVFEDGPKRDRRLWLGDFYLQAMSNYLSFKNYDLAERCLYLFAACADEKGLVPSCLYEKPAIHSGRQFIYDYTALFAPSVLDYVNATGKSEIAHEFWDLMLRQNEILMEDIDENGLFHNMHKWWLFIDWNPELDKDCSEQAILIFSSKQLCKLAELCNHQEIIPKLEKQIKLLSDAALKYMYDAELKVFVSGEKRQISWASQAWMSIAGVLPPETMREAFKSLRNNASAQKPVAPYLYHYVVEGLLLCGMKEDAFELIKSYWGKMAELGADTFWEVFAPEDHKLSPYKSHLVNSSCHAWSCTPTYFIRKYKNHLWPE